MTQARNVVAADMIGGDVDLSPAIEQSPPITPLGLDEYEIQAN